MSFNNSPIVFKKNLKSAEYGVELIRPQESLVTASYGSCAFLPAISKLDVKQNHISKVNDNNSYQFTIRGSISNDYISVGLSITMNKALLCCWLLSSNIDET